MIRILILLCLLIQGEKNLFSQVSAHSKVSATIVASGSTASLETPVVENAGNYALEISSFYKRTKDIMPNQPATVAFVNVAGNPHTYNIGLVSPLLKVQTREGEQTLAVAAFSVTPLTTAGARQHTQVFAIEAVLKAETALAPGQTYSSDPLLMMVCYN